MGHITKIPGSRHRSMIGRLCFLMVLCVVVDHLSARVGVEGLPVSPPKAKTESVAEHAVDKKDEGNDAIGETALEYDRYLREVVQTLESDPDFRKKLDEAPEADIRVRFC